MLYIILNNYCNNYINNIFINCVIDNYIYSDIRFIRNIIVENIFQVSILL